MTAIELSSICSFFAGVVSSLVFALAASKEW